MSDAQARTSAAGPPLVLPLALTQFIASYAATNMNAAISTIAADLGSTVIGIQHTITLFTLTMAALMIAGSKLTARWGRKNCFVAGLAVYGSGALLAALAPGPGLLLVGYSVLQGAGSALMIPPIYILITVTCTGLAARARAFGVVSGAAGLGAAAGPLVGGLLTSGVVWRAAFLVQDLVVVWILILARRIEDPPLSGPRPQFDLVGAVLSGAGLFFLVFGILQSGTYGWLVARQAFTIGGITLIKQGGISPVWLFAGIGALILFWFFLHLRARERVGEEPLLPLRLFRDRTANLGLATQNIQWLVLQGNFFVISVYLQQARGYNAIQTGLMLTPATVGILATSAAAARMAARHPPRWLIVAGFTLTAAGMALLPLLIREQSGVVGFVPGLLLIGAGTGIMLTASVDLVQSSFPEGDQSDISGLSRSVSNLGSSLGTALAGSVLVAATHIEGRPFLLALVVLGIITAGGLIIALCLPRRPAAGDPAGDPG